MIVKMMIISALVILASSTIVHGATDQWVYTSHGNIPEFAVKGGDDGGYNGWDLYVCKGYARGYMASGKAANHLGTCKLPYGGEEHDDDYYHVLTSPPWLEYSYSWSTNTYDYGAIPSGAVHVYSDIYVGRYMHDGYYIPGKVVTGNENLYFGYRGDEHSRHTGYEVLIRKYRPISYYYLYNVNYDFSNAIEIVSPNPVTMASDSVTNTGPTDVQTTVSLDVTHTTTSEWVETHGIPVVSGRTWSVNAGIPRTNVEEPTGWEEGPSSTYTYTHGEFYVTSVLVTYDINVNVPANSTVDVTMVAREASVDVPFTSSFRIVPSSGSSYTYYGESGVYKDVHYTSFQTLVNGKPM